MSAAQQKDRFDPFKVTDPFDGNDDVKFTNDAYPAEGQVQPKPLRMTYQVNQGNNPGPILPLDLSGLTQNDPEGHPDLWTWHITLTGEDCPDLSTWYTLIVYAYDNSGSGRCWSNFKRTR